VSPSVARAVQPAEPRFISAFSAQRRGLVQRCVSIHASTSLHKELWRGLLVVVHPDMLFDMSLRCLFGPLLCVENMDKRKPTGRTAKELDSISKELPDASLCLDIGHARQWDPATTETYLILKEFSSKLRQIHVSEVNKKSKHDPLSYRWWGGGAGGFACLSPGMPDYASIKAFQGVVAHPIPPPSALSSALRPTNAVPLIPETPVGITDVKAEIAKPREALAAQPKDNGCLKVMKRPCERPPAGPPRCRRPSAHVRRGRRVRNRRARPGNPGLYLRLRSSNSRSDAARSCSKSVSSLISERLPPAKSSP